MRFFRYMQNALQTGLPLHRGPVGEPRGGSFVGTFERKEKSIWVPFLDPEAIKIWSLGAIWKFIKGTGVSWVDMRLWGTKGPSIRPRCIGNVRAQTTCWSINNQSVNIPRGTTFVLCFSEHYPVCPCKWHLQTVKYHFLMVSGIASFVGACGEGVITMATPDINY
jgi:hypothetical protein